ncbi:hypothetical protein BDV41DRAFT_538834 [Aspergillus transmontanensis]|uniref:Uncharacterized protein n=1 Tax=Aspergillus transmontanensis TaxID=1034304 RepID=A0A5N6VWI3_9EURO|nr:hypothetical protein BDV41DRAFT_538834 [Aspergillus transmontanensis]
MIIGRVIKNDSTGSDVSLKYLYTMRTTSAIPADCSNISCSSQTYRVRRGFAETRFISDHI